MNALCGIIGNINKNGEDRGDQCDFNCGGLDQKISEEKYFGMWPRNSSCNVLANNVAPCCQFPKCLP